ncbi:MAG TPA: ABC transporter ATP-binding protein [Gemmatimonadales bacterium]|nr:ABC transporter ATP-binding protein [Gemmatimonadales bacterium]
MSRDLQRVVAWIRPYWPALGLVAGLSSLSTLLSLALPYLSKQLVDDALLRRDQGILVRLVLVFAGIALGSFFINVASGLKYTRVSAAILFDMRLALYRHLQQLSPRFYAATPLGQIVTRLNTDIGEVQRVAAETLLAWIGSVIALVGTVVMLALLDWKLFLVSLASVPLSVWALVRYRARLEGAVARARERSADMGSFLIETLQAQRLVVTSNAADREVGRFQTRNDAYVDAIMRMRRLTYLAGGLPGLLLGLGTSVVFLYGGSRVIGGTLTLGTFVAFTAYQMRLLAPVQAMMGLYAGLASARVSLRRVLEILDIPIEVREAEAARPLSCASGEVTFERVRFTFDRGAPVLDNLSFTLKPGERVALVGPSGSGKSTIGDLLVRLLDPAEGRILLDGHDLRELRLADVRRHVVRVDQEPPIFNATIAENIRYTRPEATDGEVASAASAAGLNHLTSRLPEGLSTQVGERGRALSAGERQRIAIARALLSDPTVLVLDEATASLDPAVEAEVLDGYEAVMRGRTTVLITHRPDLAARADRVISLARN